MGRPPVDVIVPVYNGHDAVARCLDSVLVRTPGDHVRIIVADDASPDSRIAPLLERFAGRDSRVQVVRRDDNMGFVLNCNAAMRDSANDVVLLNSDTEVPPGWLDRLQDLALSSGRVGSVTPLSNNATVCSVPEWLVPNRYPLSLDVESLDRVAAASGTGEWIEIPTSVGFCVYLRRDALDACGLFDEEMFGTGYGEENDLSCRMREQGYLNLLCDNVFVWHEGGVSFADSGTGDLTGNLQRITERWPRYHHVIRDFIALNPLRGVQARFGLELLRATKKDAPRVLYVIHNPLWSGVIGGTEFHAEDLIEALGSRVDPVVLSFGDGGEGRVQWRSEGVPVTFPLDAADIAARPSEWVAALLSTGIDVVHVQHPLRMPVSGLDAMLTAAARRGVPVVWTTHDYFGLCPAAQLLDHASGAPCTSLGGGAQCEGCEVRADALGGVDVESWRALWRGLMSRADVLVAPSRAAAGLISGAWPELTDRFTVLPHGVDASDAPSPEPPESGHAVAVLGYGGMQKGDAMLEGVIDSLGDLDVTWHLFGRTALGATARNNVRIHGNYRRQDLPKILSDVNVDLVLLPSPWPETYSYTLSEAWRQGLPVVGSALGAIGERITAHGGGVIVDPGDVEAVTATMRAVLTDGSALAAMREQAGRIGASLPAVDAMADEYDRLYGSLVTGVGTAAPGPVGPEPDEAEMRLWMTSFQSPLRA